MNQSFEVNFDGLVGPTHNYAGLSFGNVASMKHGSLVAHPKSAALQGLEKMWALKQMGLVQAVLPPQERPCMEELRRRGFEGSDEEVIRKAFKEAPDVLSTCSSASAMWTANAMTVAPKADTTDHRTHLLPANLVSKPHRAIEWPTTTKVLKSIFADEKFFEVHEALPRELDLGDEGAANHTRLCTSYAEAGLHLFVYGRIAKTAGHPEPKKFPARQTLEASKQVAHDLQIDPMRVLFVQQNPEVIDAGVFHNDVISVGNENVLFFHEAAFLETERALDQIQEKFLKLTGHPLIPIRVSGTGVPLEEAVKSYLFNTQLVSLPHGGMAIIAPIECAETPSVKAKLDQILTDTNNPIKEVRYFDLRQSMQNGGGPACLRNRVVLTSEEIAALKGRVILDEALYLDLTAWVNKHYRDEIKPEDLGDPALLMECQAALSDLAGVLQIDWGQVS